jgi:hypothetical protein
MQIYGLCKGFDRSMRTVAQKPEPAVSADDGMNKQRIGLSAFMGGTGLVDVNRVPAVPFGPCELHRTLMSAVGSKCEGASARLDVRFHSDSDRVADFGAILKSAKTGLEAMMSAYVHLKSSVQ